MPLNVTATLRDHNGVVVPVIIRNGSLTITGDPVAPAASFTVNRTSGDTPLTVKFYDTSSEQVAVGQIILNGKVDKFTCDSSTYTCYENP
jgi:PKD repeat protein